MLLTLVTFFIVLGILVLVHELGHFFTARFFGVRVEEFGFGLPPRIFGIKYITIQKIKKIFRQEDIDIDIKDKQIAGAEVIQEKIVDKVEEIKQTVPVKKRFFIWGKKDRSGQVDQGTIYSLNWIPLGGFVKIKGENGEDASDQDSFGHQKVWRRIVIISAGVFMNFVLAVVFLTLSLAIGSPQAIDESRLSKFALVSDPEIRVIEVLAGSPADQAGLKVADTILAVDNQKFEEMIKLQTYVDQKVGQKINLTIERDQSIINTELTPTVLSQTNKGGMGVGLVKTGFVSYPWYLAPWYGLVETVKMVWEILLGFYLIIQNLLVNREMIGDVYGPVGIATLVGDAARLGFLYLLQFTAVLSVIIAVINFLPFPALDGGRVLFLIIEAVRRKPINQKFENLMHNLGFALLMILALVVTVRDIARLSAGFLGWWEKIISLF